jgi:hypothetical protein
MAKLKHLGALPINLVICSGENCTQIRQGEVIPLGYTSVADPDLSFQFLLDADPDPTFHCDADLYPEKMHLQPSVYRPSSPPFVRVYGSPWLHFEPTQLLNFDFDAGPDHF